MRGQEMSVQPCVEVGHTLKGPGSREVVRTCARGLDGLQFGRAAEREDPMPPESEQDRLRRLRDRQIAARDPQVKQQRIHGKIARKQRSSVEAFSLGRILSEIPNMWKGAFLGFLVGVLGVAVIPLVWSSPWALPCAAALTVILAIFGLIVGRAADTRDSLKDLMR